MFTGIVEEKGIVQKLEREKNLFILKVKAKKVLSGLKKGSSVSVNGACLTVTKITKDVISFDIMRETILKTTLKNLKPKENVNLERAIKLNERFDGHFVTGHVDGVGTIQKITTLPNYVEHSIICPRGLSKYFVPKGSVSVDGVSLTIGEVKKGKFSVYLIPFTKRHTTLGSKKEGQEVNIETDILARYILSKGERK